MHAPTVRPAALPTFRLVAAPFSLFLCGAALSQPVPASPPPIQDNSFLIEEAYNQERHVVQTIQTFSRLSGSGDWTYTLTQEWPVPDQTNQLSVTVPIQNVSFGNGRASGAGDVALNYRYQAVGSGETKVAFSPRLTALFPTGSSTRGLGSGGFGLQMNLPLSVALSERFVAHTNLGATHVFSALNVAGDRAALTSYNAGQSVIWLARGDLNLMLEALVTSTASVVPGGGTDRRLDVWVSPGIRFALNLPGRLQVVPGIGFPIGLGPSRGQKSVFVYLSVELPVVRGNS